MNRTAAHSESESADVAVQVPKFHLKMLGGLVLTTAEGTPIELPTKKTRLLVAYLATPAGQVHSRNKVAGLLWHDRAEEQARGSLRKALSALRAIIGDEAIHSDHETVRLDPGFLAVDTARLEALAREPEGHWEIAELQRLSAPFLEGIEFAGDELTEWLRFERTRCLSLAQRLLGNAADAVAEAGNGPDAVTLAQRLVALDPLREQSHRLLMKIFARQGERSLALAQFQRCRQLLRTELGVEPSIETIRLSETLAKESGDVLAPPARVAAAPIAEAYKYSIAVLPFANPSEEPEQKFLAEGLAEDIITELSRHKDLNLIARQSSFQLGPELTTVDAAERLGVRYVLAGTVRRAGNRVRVGVQLIDSGSQTSIWAERYDREIGDIFDIQDEIAEQVVAAVDTELRYAERERAARVRPENLDAWELFHRGLWHAYNFTADDWNLAHEFFTRSTQIAPDFALPHAGLAYLELLAVNRLRVPDPAAAIERGLAHARRAWALDATNPFVLVVLGRLLTIAGKVDLALDYLTFAQKQNPNYAHVHYGLALAYFWAGRPRDALSSADTAARLSPREPLTSNFLTLTAFSHLWLGDLAAAEQAARRAMQLQARETWSRLALAVSLVEGGRIQAAHDAIDEVRRIDPGLTIASTYTMIRHAPQAIRDRVHAALRTAGLPA